MVNQNTQGEITMKKIIMTIMSLGLFALVGCQTVPTAEKAASVIVSAVDLKYYYEDGEIADVVIKDTFTTEEEDRVLRGLIVVDAAKSRLKEIQAEPTKLITQLPYISQNYIVLKDTYLDVREIVLAHRAEYTDQEWTQLQRFDQAVQALDREFANLVASMKSQEAISAALRLADLTFKVGTL
jgi:hypothetical protein